MLPDAVHFIFTDMKTWSKLKANPSYILSDIPQTVKTERFIVLIVIHSMKQLTKNT